MAAVTVVSFLRLLKRRARITPGKKEEEKMSASPCIPPSKVPRKAKKGVLTRGFRASSKFFRTEK